MLVISGRTGIIFYENKNFEDICDWTHGQEFSLTRICLLCVSAYHDMMNGVTLHFFFELAFKHKVERQ